jgi:AraC-like DNA-binding protein
MEKTELSAFPMAAPSAQTPSVVCVVNKRSVESGKYWEQKASCHFLGMLLEGGGLIRFGKAERTELRAPFFWIFPKGSVGGERIDGKVQSWYTGFHWPGLSIRDEGRVDLLMRLNGRSLRINRWKVPDPQSVTRIVDLFKRLKAAFEREDFSAPMQTSALLMELFCYFVDSSDVESEHLSHRALARFHELIQQHACEDISIEDLAEKSGVTADYLRNLFQERFGMRPVEYRTALRLARARDHLISSDMNVKEAARHAGYPDALYFSRVFRHQFGMSPSEMIKRYRLPH